MSFSHLIFCTAFCRRPLFGAFLFLKQLPLRFFPSSPESKICARVRSACDVRLGERKHSSSFQSAFYCRLSAPLFTSFGAEQEERTDRGFQRGRNFAELSSIAFVIVGGSVTYTFLRAFFRCSKCFDVCSVVALSSHRTRNNRNVTGGEGARLGGRIGSSQDRPTGGTNKRSNFYKYLCSFLRDEQNECSARTYRVRCTLRDAAPRPHIFLLNRHLVSFSLEFIFPGTPASNFARAICMRKRGRALQTLARYVISSLRLPIFKS